MKVKTQSIIAIALVMTIICVLIDKPLISFIMQITPGFTIPFFEWISYPISVFVVLILMTTLFLWEERKEHYIAPLLVGIVFTVFTIFALKFAFHRARPDEVLYILNFVDYSFPSAHSAIGFATIPVLDKEFPKLKFFWIAFAVLIGLSRVVLNLHYVSDVIAGAIIGYLCGYTVLRLEEKGAARASAGD